jgi:hypothetical protein
MRRVWEHNGEPICTAAFWEGSGLSEITVEVRHMTERTAVALQRALGEAVEQVAAWREAHNRARKPL